MNNVITVSGDRQAGKTVALLSVVGVTAMRGDSALWVTHDLRTAGHHADDLAELIGPMVSRVSRTAGSPCVETVSGGRVHFRSAGQRRVPRYSIAQLGSKCSAFVFDDVAVPLWLERQFPDARIYVTETTGAAAGPEHRTAALVRAVREFVHGEESCPMPDSDLPCIYADCPVHAGVRA